MNFSLVQIAAVAQIVGTLYIVWIGYANASSGQAVKATIDFIVVALLITSGILCYRIISKKLTDAVNTKPTDNSEPSAATLHAAEQRIADLERKLEQQLARNESALPALRPSLVPVRWGRTPDNRCGLFMRNDGEPAFDISMEEPVFVGKSKLQFWDRIQAGLTKADGEFFMEAHIELATGYGVTAGALRDEMLKADMASSC